MLKHILISYIIFFKANRTRKTLVRYSVGGRAGVARAPVGVAGRRGGRTGVGLTAGQGDGAHRGVHGFAPEIAV